MKNQKHIEAIARETFRGVNVFFQNKDVEGLRHYVHPELLDKWKKDWKSFTPQSVFEKFEMKVINQSSSTFTVEFQTKFNSQVWSFECEEEKWKLNSAKIAVSFEYKKVG